MIPRSRHASAASATQQPRCTPSHISCSRELRDIDLDALSPREALGAQAVVIAGAAPALRVPLTARHLVKESQSFHPHRADSRRAWLAIPPKCRKEQAHDGEAVRAQVHEDQRPHRGPAGADAARDSRQGSRSRYRRVAAVRARRGSDNIELSAALHPTESDIPADAMLDPVANTLDLRQPFDKKRAQRVFTAMKQTGVGLSDLGYFDNMLHDDPAVRKKKFDFMLRVFDAAVLLEKPAVVGFVGRNQKLQMDQNLQMFEEVFIPLLKEAKARGIEYRVEQCPMPGWTTLDNFHNNIAYAPGPWIALARICEKHGVGDNFRIHYDPSHAILMGQDTRSIFQYLKDEGYDHLIGGFHVKGQVVDAKGVAGWGYGGQTMERGDWINGKPSPKPAGSPQRLEEAGRSVRARAARHGQARSAGLPAEPHRRLARPSARRARAAEARRGQHLPGDRARVSEGAHPGQGKAQAHPGRFDRLHAQDRRGGSLHVCAPARSAARLRDTDPGARPPGLFDVAPCPLADNHTAPEAQHGQEEIERRNDRVRLHGSRPFQCLAPGGALHADVPFEPVMKVVAGRTEAKVKEAAERLGWEEYATRWEDVIARKDIDIIDICTPGDSHMPIAIAAAEAKKNILCEKPLANTLADAEKMWNAATKAGVIHMLCHNYRRCPAVALAKQLIDAGKIGKIYHYRGTYLQDWIVDPAFPRVWRLVKSRAGSGRSATSSRTRWICRATWSASRSR